MDFSVTHCLNNPYYLVLWYPGTGTWPGTRLNNSLMKYCVYIRYQYLLPLKTFEKKEV